MVGQDRERSLRQVEGEGRKDRRSGQGSSAWAAEQGQQSGQQGGGNRVCLYSIRLCIAGQHTSATPHSNPDCSAIAHLSSHSNGLLARQRTQKYAAGVQLNVDMHKAETGVPAGPQVQQVMLRAGGQQREVCS